MRRLLVVTLIAPLFMAPFATPAAAAACARVPQDFNGDGYGDLAVSAPNTYDPDWDVNWQGAVHVAYGSPTGFDRPHSVTGTDKGLPYGKFAGSSRLGAAMAPGYFDDDCYADLAISSASASNMLVMYGSPAGLVTERSQHFDRESIQPGGAYGSHFSHDIAAGDFNGDGFDDIAAGAPYADDNRGAFGILFGSAAGVVTAGAQWISQDSPGVPDTAEPDDLFGWTLAAADFNGDGRTDLAAGAYGENVGNATDAGAVIVFHGAAAGLATAGSQSWDQNSPGVADSANQWDAFGSVMAAGDITGDGKAELVVGSPYEATGAASSAGMIHTFRGTATGLIVGPAFDQNTGAIPGIGEISDQFGSALALADLNRDGRLDIAVGAPGESTGSASATGSVTILTGTANGPTDVGATLIDQNSTGVPGNNETDDQFGLRLNRVPQVLAGDVLVIGAPFERVVHPADGAVTILPSAAAGTTRRNGVYLSAGNFPLGDQANANFGLGLPS